MKKTVFFLFLLSVGVFSKDYKVVFDCSSGDAAYLKSRMWLIGKTIDMFKEKGDTLEVAITMHGKCSLLASEDFDVVVDEKDVKTIRTAQEYLQKLTKRSNVKATVCAMSLDANGVEQESILDGISISANSFIDTIKYQKDGFALMSFK